MAINVRPIRKEPLDVFFIDMEGSIEKYHTFSVDYQSWIESAYTPTVMSGYTPKHESLLVAEFIGIVELGTEYIINLYSGEVAFTYKGLVTEIYVDSVSGVAMTTAKLHSSTPPLYGTHLPSMKKVRYELGDGTFRQQYALEGETGTVIERFYNKNHLWED